MLLPLTGRTVLVTGTIPGLSRDEAKAAVTALGGTPAAGVTGKVDLIVLGEGAGVSKTAKARSLRIAALDGETFAALAADPTGWDGTEVGLSFADYDARFAPEPDEPALRLDRDHLIAKAVLHVPLAEGGTQRQVRLRCACGHKWMRHALWGDDRCPRPTVPTTTPPWEQRTS